MSSGRSSTGRGHPPDRGPAPGAAELIALAREVTRATGRPVVGGVAVILRGGGRSTEDIDLYSEDFWATHERLESIGALWNAAAREHRYQGVPVHMVSAEMLGGAPRKISMLQHVRVISLADLVRTKLELGLTTVRRSKDLAHVLDLIERVPLKKEFAARLPVRLRGAFRRLVEQVHGRRRTTVSPREFRKQHA